MTDASPGGDPIARFVALFEQANKLPREVLPEPTAFALATADERGTPSVRIVLLKSVDESGFVFYTNHDSRKGRELLATRRAALCFHWQPMEVQVRVEGAADAVSAEEADAYFASRARGSQIGAWASLQSRRIEHAGDLEARVAEMEERFARGPVPRPPQWSGFRVAPTRIEFWKGRPNRLHIRDVYERDGNEWRVSRLYP
jgi:pyridoxamine 5'-phosphate oxidase